MEKQNYRETLEYLAERHPMLLSKGETAALLSVSRDTLRKIIRSGKIKEANGMIPLGSVASYLCG